MVQEINVPFSSSDSLTEGSWGFSELQSWCKFFGTSFFVGHEKVCAWLEFVFSQLWVLVWFCCSPCTCCSVLSGTAKQSLGQSRVCVCWKEKFQYSKFQSVLININMNTPPLCLSMCSKWNENHEEIGKQFWPCWSKHSCWPQPGSSCGQGCAGNWEFGEPEQQSENARVLSLSGCYEVEQN